MKLLIAGGAGYIGSVITNLALQQGHQVKVIDTLWFQKDIPLIHLSNPNYEFIRGDICDKNIAKEIIKNMDFIINAAAVVGDPASKKFPDLTYKTNYEACINLAELGIKNKIKGFIFFSTCSNYGIADGLANEETILNPLSAYAIAKVKAEEHLMNKIDGLDLIICRLSTVYGISPRMRFDLTVNDFTMNAYMKKYLNIFLPYSHRPYIHVYDVAKIIMELLKNFEKVKNNVFNIGFNGENYQKIQIADIVKENIPETKIEIVKTGSDLRDYQVDFSKLKKFLNIKNTYTIKNGVEEIIEMLKNRIITDPYKDYYYDTLPDIGGKKNE
jgi:nucleoside-diphosphate-sugar epimerase